MHISHAIDCIRGLAANNSDQDPTALAHLSDAITILTQVRARLIDNADRLT